MHGIFVFNRMNVYTQTYGHDWSIVAPIPWFPRLPFKTSKLYDLYARIPQNEVFQGRGLEHPRYLVTPKVGMRFYGSWFTQGVAARVRAIHKKHPIDIIDGHYVFPDGTAAVKLGKELGIPVILSARGTDLNLFPTLPHIAPLVKENLSGCNHLICVCSELKAVALNLGMPEKKISVIGNGVDTSLFNPGDQAKARLALQLPLDKKIILSTGGMTERKGFHILIEAIAKIKRSDLLLVIIGDGPDREKLAALAITLGVANQVRLIGAIPNRQLPSWYQSADLFVLASSREGWPNVLCEAQACGIPSIATKAWGMPEIISHEKLGILVEARTPTSFQEAIIKALGTDWNKSYIAANGGSRTWKTVAENLETLFSKESRK